MMGTVAVAAASPPWWETAIGAGAGAALGSIAGGPIGAIIGATTGALIVYDLNNLGTAQSKTPTSLTTAQEEYAVPLTESTAT